MATAPSKCQDVHETTLGTISCRHPVSQPTHYFILNILFLVHLTFPTCYSFSFIDLLTHFQLLDSKIRQFFIFSLTERIDISIETGNVSAAEVKFQFLTADFRHL